MRRLLLRLVRDLSLIPATAIAVYVLVMHIPYRGDMDPKHAVGGAESPLGNGSIGGFVTLWERFAHGSSLSVRGIPFTAGDFAQALGTSVGLGSGALAMALIGAAIFAVLRVQLSGRAAGRFLEIVPALVFGTPIFIFAVVMALLGPLVDLPFSGSVLLASSCMAIAPCTFIGVVLSDALAVERERPYFATALAQGMTHREALVRHALPNALPAVLDAVSPVAVSLLAGSFVCETLFAVHGFGALYLNAAQTADPGVVVVATTVFAALLLSVSLVVELLRLVVDPKARRSFEEAA
jgi:oligopeptide transport system permease protein